MIDSKFDNTPAHNYAFPDSGAVYWTASITMPPGSKIVFQGEFPHARYTSYNVYSSTTHGPTDNLHDISIVPNPGSTNPFQVGANRNASKRAYTVTMLDQTPPAARAANTLYAAVPGQTQQVVMLRIYEPDDFTPRTLTGGEPLPTPVLHLADGSVQTGQAECQTLHALRGPLPLTTLPKALYDSLRDQPGKPATFPAAPTPLFRTFYNIPFTLACWYQGNCTGSTALTGGQYSNIDNRYVAAFVNRGFNAGPVLVLRGKLPTTPNTGLGVARMGAGQLRYWSMCQNESIFTTKGAGCVYDSEVPVNKQGYYTIITSLAKDRPSNATAKCGVAYIPWPKNGDGDGHLNDGLLIMRNMLPSPSFHHAIQDTTVPGDEQHVLGPYYPRGQYTTKTAFQKLGCKA
jgi:hypothetical protein